MPCFSVPRPSVALALILIAAASCSSAEPYVYEPAAPMGGRTAAPLVRQAPDFGRAPAPRVRNPAPPPLVRQSPAFGGPSEPAMTPLHRRTLQERLEDLERDQAMGDLDPIGRRRLQNTRQEIRDFDRHRR
jgi:hypothetical protein